MYQRDLRRFDPFSQSYQHQIETRPLRVNDVFIDRFCKKKAAFVLFCCELFFCQKETEKSSRLYSSQECIEISTRSKVVKN